MLRSVADTVVAYVGKRVTCSKRQVISNLDLSALMASCKTAVHGAPFCDEMSFLSCAIREPTVTEVPKYRTPSTVTVEI